MSLSHSRRPFALVCTMGLLASLVLAGCSGGSSVEQSPSEATAVVDTPDGQYTATVSSEPSEGSPSKRLSVLRSQVEDELQRAFRAQNPAEVNFDSLAKVQNSAFDKISLAGSEGVGCSYSLSTLSDHIFVYLACEDDTQEFEWRPAS